MEKLFYQDIHLTDFEALVTECVLDEKRNLYRILLDRTAFFPEEGGQVADRGVLIEENDAEKLSSAQLPAKNTEDNAESPAVHTLEDVTIEGDLIYHYTTSPIPANTRVRGLVDWAQRFDFMQQHTGEHIISGLVHKHYGYNNVGFHLGLSEVTLDFNGVLSLEQLRSIEKEANDAVWANLPVSVSFPSPEKLSCMNYRSKLELTENVRIVEIPDIDTCACCAPHVENTGMIGLIKITNVQSHRGGVRVNILCGGRALSDYTEKQDAVSSVSSLLSAKQDAIPQAVTRLLEESAQRKNRANTLQAQLLSLKLGSLPAPSEIENVLIFVGDMDNIAMRNAVNSLTETYKGYCGIFSGEEEEANSPSDFRFIIGSASKDCKSLAAKLRQRFGAKGGGSAPMIQGSIAASEEELRAFFQ